MGVRSWRQTRRSSPLPRHGRRSKVSHFGGACAATSGSQVVSVTRRNYFVGVVHWAYGAHPSVILFERAWPVSLQALLSFVHFFLFHAHLCSSPLQQFQIYNSILRRYPSATYEFFSCHGNTFSTTIFVLVSAIQKLSRCVHISPGTLLYRGLGGKLDLPDSFQDVDDNGCLGYTEWGFMSTTADKAIALQYSGVKEGHGNSSIMVIHPTSIDRGACIVEFSQCVCAHVYLF